MPDNKPRCQWAGADPLMQRYHDEEWGVPQHDSRMLWEMLMLEGFQAGLSWSIILKRREGFRKAFKNFDPAKVAKFTEADVERLMQDEGIVRARSKIVATIEGAKIYQGMKKDGEDFSQWVWSFVHNKPIQNTGPIPAKTELSETISKALRKRGFKFVGPVIVYAWMQACGLVNDHSEHCFRRKAVANQRTLSNKLSANLSARKQSMPLSVRAHGSSAERRNIRGDGTFLLRQKKATAIRRCNGVVGPLKECGH